MLMKLRTPRLKKMIKATLENGTGIIENISTSGGFLKTDCELLQDRFRMKLKVMGCKTVKINCERKWNNASGVGFKIMNIENSKQALFNTYLENQFHALKEYGDKRVFTTEVQVTLKDTNVFGNVYFSNFIEYQGVIREKFLLATVPDLHELLAQSRIRLVTVDTYNRFVNNAYFGDTLLMELTASDINGATCKLNISFKNKATGQLVGQGYQRFCVVSAEGKVIRIPEVLLNPLDFFQEVEN
jgi:enediyne biosynthesis thioesterase